MKYLLLICLLTCSVLGAQRPMSAISVRISTNPTECCGTLLLNEDEYQDGNLIRSYTESKTGKQFGYAISTVFDENFKTHGVITKIDEDNDVLWQLEIPAASYIRDLDVYNNGDVVIVGVDGSFGTGLKTIGGNYAFIAKISSSGQLIRYREFSVGESNANYLKDFTHVVVDRNNDEAVYVLGNDPVLRYPNKIPTRVSRIFAAKYSADLNKAFWRRVYYYGRNRDLAYYPADIVLGENNSLWIIANRGSREGVGIAMKVYKSHGQRHYLRTLVAQNHTFKSIAPISDGFIAIGEQLGGLAKGAQAGFGVTRIFKFDFGFSTSQAVDIYSSDLNYVAELKSETGSENKTVIIRQGNDRANKVLEINKDIFNPQSPRSFSAIRVPSSIYRVSDMPDYASGFYLDGIDPAGDAPYQYRLGNLDGLLCQTPITIPTTNVTWDKFKNTGIGYANATGTDRIISKTFLQRKTSTFICFPQDFEPLELCPDADPILASSRFSISLADCQLPPGGDYTVVVTNTMGYPVDASLITVANGEVTVNLSGDGTPPGRYFVTISDGLGNAFTIPIEISA